MPQFNVRRYNMGIWDKQDPQDVVASSAKEAAEKACGERLIAAGTLDASIFLRRGSMLVFLEYNANGQVGFLDPNINSAFWIA